VVQTTAKKQVTAFVAVTCLLDAEGTLTGDHYVFTLAIPGRFRDFHLLADPPADLFQAPIAAAVGTATGMSARQGRATSRQYDTEPEQQSVHIEILIGGSPYVPVSTLVSRGIY
jgi:hypothetical protein